MRPKDWDRGKIKLDYRANRITLLNFCWVNRKELCFSIELKG